MPRWPRMGRAVRLVWAGAAVMGMAAGSWAQHGHLNTGATGTSQGDSLMFANGHLFAAESGYVKDLPLADSGRFAGFFEGNITFTVLATTVDNGGPVPNAPASGSFVMAGIQSVSGPEGGRFGFWEAGSTVPTFEYGVGYDVAIPTGLWALSDASLGAGTPGADPYGHLHGRRFTATVPGLYEVSFRAFDLSGNGAGGGPIHTPSDVITIAFNAVPEPGVGTLLGMGTLGLLAMGWMRRGGRRQS